ncbi:High-affinity choline transporter 1 [Nymphon striatum]|nr:High-affinity choline transporter 1 [Nymphon striatum]
MAVNIPGVISIVVFYALILAVGIWASRKKGKSKNVDGKTEDAILAGRDIGMFVGIFTMTATWVGGGYINGSAEIIFSKGMLWCQAPVGFTLSLILAYSFYLIASNSKRYPILGGIFFAGPMRKKGYVTMLDPFQQKFGNRCGGLLFIPAVCGEVLWCASILAALGSTTSVILDLDYTIAITVSSSIAIIYTLMGGLYSVAYTDVIQLFCIFFGLWLCVPFAMTNKAVSSINLNVTDWIGTVDTTHIGQFIDTYIFLIFGGIPWQVYFQRVLSSRGPRQSQIMSIVGGFGCFVFVIPAVLIGAVASATNWSETAYGRNITEDEANQVLPLVLQYLTPPAVSFFGLGAVAAAVMSSADSTVLSASSMFTRNVYSLALRPKATDRELVWVMKIAILVNGVISTTIALYAKSIYTLFAISGDIVFVILFPQLLTVVHFPDRINTYGSLASFFLGFGLRVVTGEKSANVPAFLKFPYYSDSDGQLFPFRSCLMIVTLVTILLVSAIASTLFKSGLVPLKYDFLGCFQEKEKSSKDGINSNGIKIQEVATIQHEGRRKNQESTIKK